MTPDILAGISATKSTIDLFKSIKGISDAVKLNNVILEAQQNISTIQQSLLEAQATIHTISEENSNLKAQLIDSSNWEDQKKRYKLGKLTAGVLVYDYIQSSNSDSTPAHKACPNCYYKKSISILQEPSEHFAGIKCFECNFHIEWSDSGIIS